MCGARRTRGAYMQRLTVIEIASPTPWSTSPVCKEADGRAGEGLAARAALEQSIVALLKKNKKMALPALGGQVKKPPGTPKLKAFMMERPSVFKIVGDQVSLA
jgi:hypothetical protein